MTDDEEASGLLALMLLHHARRAARTTPDGTLVPLAEQDRSRWDTQLIAEGVAILQAALARDRLGEYQVQAAIAALHADAQTVDETDWVQIVEWYDELDRLTDNPVVRLNRAVAVGEADGPQAGLAALEQVDRAVPRYSAVEAYLRERAGDLAVAARLYGDAARAATNLAERDHLTRQAARLNGVVRGRPSSSAGQAPTYAARCSPVRVEPSATRSAGVPSKTIRPPSWPAPGPRSMIQSACAITAWWCSMTMTDLPESTSRSSRPSSCSTSARCRPVVGSSRT